METVHDTNNNTTSEKSYSLRPRTAVRRDDQEVDQEDLWKPRNKSKKKPKHKSVPLSKYRRKTANARERFRMREINEAFEALRRAMPHLSSNCENPNEKLTKISTLRLAMKYITALSNALQDTDMDSDGDSFLTEWTSTPPDLRESSTPSSINEHSDLYDQFFSPSSSSESSPSASSPYSLSALLTPPPPCEFSNPAGHLNTLFTFPNYSTESSPPFKQHVTASTKTDRHQLSASSGLNNPQSQFPKGPLMTNGVPEVSTIVDDLSHHFLTSADLQTCSPSLLDELEGLSSPSVDLDDYLIT